MFDICSLNSQTYFTLLKKCLNILLSFTESDTDQIVANIMISTSLTDYELFHLSKSINCVSYIKVIKVLHILFWIIVKKLSRFL